MTTSVKSTYKKSTRVRVCGLLIRDNALLLVKHLGLGPKGYAWLPPGGGVEFEESVEEGLIREFREETHLTVSVGEFLFVNEYRDQNFHSVELFFKVNYVSGDLQKGSDPEYDQQIISEVAFLPWQTITDIDPRRKHNIFSKCPRSYEILSLRGFYEFANIW